MRHSILNTLKIHRCDQDAIEHSLPKPTNAVPGSPEKLDVLKARMEAGEQLHHPNDRRSQSVVKLKDNVLCQLEEAL